VGDLPMKKADIPMIESLLRFLSVVACCFVLLSYGLFAVRELSTASARQTAAVETSQAAAVPRPEEAKEQPRRFIDGGAQLLLRPFETLAPEGNAWAQRTLPTLLALFVYGFGLAVLARYTSSLPRRAA
jgi:hypothetical protein